MQRSWGGGSEKSQVGTSPGVWQCAHKALLLAAALTIHRDKLSLPVSSPAWPEAELQNHLMVFSGVDGAGNPRQQMKNEMCEWLQREEGRALISACYLEKPLKGMVARIKS